MHGQGFFFQAFVYLGAAVVAVPIAKRLGLGSVLGYLIAGMLIGPFGVELIGEEGEDVMHFAEFGVVMMLFLIGLELQPSLLWRMRGPILGMGGLQVLVSAVLLGSLAALAGFAWNEAMAVGLILALSSTAIVLQTLSEKGLLNTDGGQSAFAVLLFQDISVIPMLAALPLLAVGPSAEAAEQAGHGASWVEGLPGWGEALVVLLAVAAVAVSGRYLMRPLFRYIARTRQTEIFTAAALLLVIGIALFMAQVGLSPALGTFVAGVVLADSEYRHALEANIEPFKGLLLGVFFIAVGASLDFGLVVEKPGAIGAMVGTLIAVKLVVLIGIGRLFKMGSDQNLLFSFSLAQGGEFAFVLFSFASQQGVLGSETTQELIAAVAMSMAITPMLMLMNEKILQPRFGTRERAARDADVIEESNAVIIAGFGRVGGIVGRFLTSNGIEATVLEFDSDHVEVLRKLGRKVFYGDASRMDLLRAAGADEAKVMLLAIDDHDKTMKMVETIRAEFPNLHLLVRARGRGEAYALIEEGVDQVYRETFETSLRMGVDTLRALGMRAYRALRAAQRFRKDDEKSLRALAGMQHDRAQYITVAREQMQLLETTMRQDLQEQDSVGDAGWDDEPIREDFADL